MFAEEKKKFLVNFIVNESWKTPLLDSSPHKNLSMRHRKPFFLLQKEKIPFVKHITYTLLPDKNENYCWENNERRISHTESSGAMTNEEKGKKRKIKEVKCLKNKNKIFIEFIYFSPSRRLQSDFTRLRIERGSISSRGNSLRMKISVPPLQCTFSWNITYLEVTAKIWK